MRNKVLDDPTRAVLDVHISPVHPAVLGLQRRRQQVIPGFPHCLSPRSLSSEAMSALHVLTCCDVKVLGHNHHASEGYAVCPRLDPFQLHAQHGERIICAIAHQECQINQLVRIGQLRQQIKVLLNVWCRISERSQDEHMLLIGERFRRRGDGIEVNVLYAGAVDLNGFVVVEDDWCL